MIIQHNISALNSYRNLSANNSALSGNLEKLSSGYRINRAGDDAAGLAISEKMRAQITGLETAQTNAEDGISLVQTAEGALQEVHTMLNRMVELAQQSANGTYQNEVDRENLESELNSLKDEINRISESTNFNGINLLDGSLSAKTTAPEVTVTGTGVVADFAATTGVYQATAAVDAGTAGDTVDYTVKFTVDGQEQEVTVSYNATGDASGSATNLVDALKENEIISRYFDVSEASQEITFTAKESGSKGAVITEMDGAAPAAADGTNSTAAINDGVQFTTNIADGDVIEIDGKTYVLNTSATESTDEVFKSTEDLLAKLESEGYKLVDENGNKLTDFAQDAILVYDPDKNGNALTLQIGDTSDDFNQLSVSIESMDTASLGIDDISIADQESAKAAVDIIKEAINKVSSTRGDLGAIQNRLDHTINNLSVTAENMTAAESRIRDVDMAKEMMEYTKNNILVQSSQAMLAQANQLPQGVLQLLQ